FFQAEDGIRYRNVTGVQTCALPIRGSQPAGGEGGGVRLPSDELLAGKLHNHAAVRGGGDEAVVLLGGDAGHGLEPVGEVGSPLQIGRASCRERGERWVGRGEDDE